MKKLFKTVFVLLTALVLTLVGACNPATSSATSVPKTDNTGLPRVLEIINSDFFYSSAGSTVEDQEEWTTALSGRYGVEISVSVPSEDGYATVMQGALKGEYTGFAKLESYTDLLYFIDSGAVLPLDEYLENNTAWKMLPQQMRDMYVVDGHIWAIPSSFYYEVDTRGFRTDWLESLGMELPTTIDEFVEFAAKAAEDETLTAIAVAAAMDLTWAVDLLEAYGLHIDESGQLPYAYDPELDAIADALLKPEAETALTMLRSLYDSGALYSVFESVTNSDLGEQLLTDGFGTAVANVSDMKYYYGLYSKAEAIYEETANWPSASEQWSELTSLYAETILTGDKTENVQVLYPIAEPYVLLKNTAQPAQTVNFFVDLLFASEDNYLEAAVGLEQNYIRNSDGTITLKSKLDEEASVEAETSIYIPRVQSNLVGRIDDYYTVAAAKIISGTEESVVLHRLEIEQYKTDMLEQALAKRIAVKKPMSYAGANSDFLFDNTYDIASAFKTCIINAITDSKRSVSEVLGEYRTTMKTLGADLVLSEANTAIGKTNTQSY